MKEIMKGIKSFEGKVVYLSDEGNVEFGEVEEKRGLTAKLRSIFDRGM